MASTDTAGATANAETSDDARPDASIDGGKNTQVDAAVTEADADNAAPRIAVPFIGGVRAPTRASTGSDEAPVGQQPETARPAGLRRRVGGWRGERVAGTGRGGARPALGALGTLALATSAAALAFGVGIATARRATDGPSPFGRIALGPWEANPTLGLADADPYTRAALARSGTIPLGQAEGIVFTADTDSAGEPLDAGCRYAIRGRMPTARRWSLMSVPRLDAADRPITLHSGALVLKRDGTFEIVLGSNVEPRNWLALPPAGAFSLRAALYDTPVTREPDLGSVTMPAIERLDCPDRPTLAAGGGR